MIKTPLYIHTRDRLHFLLKVLPAWFQQDVGRITLVIERPDYFITRRFLQEHGWWNRVELLRLAKPNAGMGYARRQAVKHADGCGYQFMFMSDDDIMPKPGYDMRVLTRFLASGKKGHAAGVGVCVPFYGINLGNDFIRDTNQPIPVSGSWGYRLFALNVQMAVAVGNFDPLLDVGWEDHELCRALISKFGVPWYIHTGAPAVSLGARFADGGIATLCDPDERARRMKECHIRIYERWGSRYINDPTKPYRCNWRRLLEDNGVSWPLVAPDGTILGRKRS